MKPSEQGPSKSSSFVPLLLIALALITLETGAITRDRGRIRALKTQIEQLEAADRKSQNADAKLESLLSNLLHLAEVDSDARAIVARHKLQVPVSTPSREAGR
jgi:hypothetical protein